MIVSKINIPCLTLENQRGHFVYYIKNKVTNKYYIGSCLHKKGVRNRFQRHIYYLRKSQHHSQKLQRSFDKYNKDFSIWEFGLLETVTKENYQEKEQFYTDKYKAYYDGYSCVALVNTVNSGPMSEKHRQAIIDSKQKMTEEEIVSIFNMYNTGLNYTQIALKIGLSSPTINTIINKKHYYPTIKNKFNLQTNDDRISQITTKPYKKNNVHKNREINISDKYIFYNIEDNKIYKSNNVAYFCTEHNLKPKSIFQILGNKVVSHTYKNWTVFRESTFSLQKLKDIVKNHNKVFRLYKSDNIIEFKNVVSFCKEYKLDETSIYNLLKGVISSYRGFYKI